MREQVDLKEIWEKCTALFLEHLQREPLLEVEIETLCSGVSVGKEEYALGSRYMHRGFYCPSPILEMTVANLRRGRIAKRLTQSSHPTNRYEFDQEGRLRLAETIYPDGHLTTEFIFYEENEVFGMTYGERDKLVMISVEQYSKGRIEYYVTIHCVWNGPEYGYQISKISYEHYHYDGVTMDVDAIHDLSEIQGMLTGWHSSGRFRLIGDEKWEMINWQDQVISPGKNAFFQSATENSFVTSMMEEVVRQFRTGDG